MKFIVSCCSFFFFVFPFLAQAEDCLVGLRVIKGFSKSAEYSRQKLEVGSFLSDVKKQLQPLPFQHYRVLDSMEKNIPLHSKGTFALKGAEDAEHRFSVSPNSMQAQQVDITLQWQGPSGEEMLSTKLKVKKW